MRSRPRLSCSRAAHRSCGVAPVAASRAFSAANAAVNAVSAQRVAWPGAVSSRLVRAHAIAAAWNPGWIAPDATASWVNR